MATDRMTPNPNPSPECNCARRHDADQIEHQATCATLAHPVCPACDGTKVVSQGGHDTGCNACYVSPQTLPAPGEVETNRRYLCELLRREGQHSGVWFADKLTEAAGLIEASTLVPTVTEDARAAFYAESSVAVQRKESDQVVTVEGFMRAIAKLNTPTLATVAAANDEGVAEQAVDTGEYRTDYQIGKADGIEAAAKVAESHFLNPNARDRILAVAIRLLSQGGGKDHAN